MARNVWPVPESLLKPVPRDMAECPSSVIGAAEVWNWRLGLVAVGFVALLFFYGQQNSRQSRESMLPFVLLGGLVVLLVALRWVFLILRARRVYRDGIATPAVVKTRVRVREKYGGGYYFAEVIFPGRDGQPQQVVFTGLRDPLAGQIPILVPRESKYAGICMNSMLPNDRTTTFRLGRIRPAKLGGKKGGSTVV